MRILESEINVVATKKSNPGSSRGWWWPFLKISKAGTTIHQIDYRPFRFADYNNALVCQKI